jgi:hypothetical protein
MRELNAAVDLDRRPVQLVARGYLARLPRVEQ